VGVIVGGIIVLTIVISLVSLSFKTVFEFGDDDYYYNDYSSGGYGMAVEEMARSSMPSISSLSKQIVVPPTPGSDYSTGETAEDFEIREHYASVETRKLDEDCQKISDLKKLDYVIFENANEAKKSCHFNFKVKRDNEAEVLKIVEDMDPENVKNRIHTNKKNVECYYNENRDF